MAALYVKEQGACVKKNGERIEVVKDDKSLFDIPIINVDNIVIVGNV